MDATELARWTRFAAKGGIGKCTALCDCVAENDGDLMFLKGDEIVVLMKLNEHEGKYLGYCEGVVGRFSGADVRFHGKLKKPVMTKRSSASNASVKSSSSRHSSSVHSPTLIRRPSADDEKPSAPISFSPSITIDPTISPSHSKHSLPASQSTSIDSSPVDNVFSIASAMSVYDNGPASPQVTAPLRVPKKIPQNPSPPTFTSHLTEESSPEPGTPPKSDFPLQGEESTTTAEQSYITYEDPSTRISVALSDAEVGIGLTMLQTLAGDDNDDDDDDNWSGSSRYSTRLSQAPAVAHVVTTDDSETQHASSSEPSIPKDPRIPNHSPSPSARSSAQDQNNAAYDPEARRPSLAPSASSTSSWENAIYDEYRYSRYSMAGKASRFSTVSTMGGANASIEQPPPIPDSRPRTDSGPSVDSRPSVESKRSLEVTSEVRPPPRLSSLNFHKFRWPTRPPIPLALQPQIQAVSENEPPDGSPLLHTTWGSPTSSKHESAASCYTTSSLAHNTYQSRQENDQNERPASQASSKVTGEGPGSQIVVEDDEELPSHVISSTLHESPLSSPEPHLDKLDTQDAESIGTDDSILQPADSHESELDAPLEPSSTTPAAASSPAPSPPPPTASKSPDHVRPSLTDLRGELVPGTSQRQSLFLPHPNAPKAPGVLSSGPMYIQSPQQRSTAMQPGPPRLNSVGIIHMALSRPVPAHAARYPFHGPTIYGRTDVDLTVSIGPVPITFSIDPFPARTPKTSIPHPTFPPRVDPSHLVDRRPATAPIPDHLPSSGVAAPPVPKPPQQPIERSATLHLPSTGDVIPRPGFSPRAPGPRPRSRSFSGFDSSAAAEPKQHHESGNTSNLPGALNVKRSLSSSNVAAPVPPPPTVSIPTSPISPSAPFASAKSIAKSSPHRPSPLSLPQNSSGSVDRDGLGSPRSPVLNINSTSTPSVLQSSLNLPAITTVASKLGLSDSLAVNISNTSTPSVLPSSPNLPAISTVASKLGPSDSSSSRPGPETPTSSQGHSVPLSPIELASEKQPIRPSTDTDAASISSDYRSFLAANSSAPGRQNSLRTKLSLPNLRRHKSKQDETSSLGSGSQTAEVDTVQVKDTDFELVRPNLPFISTRNSEDTGRDGSLEPPPSLIAPGSPALSTFSNRSANGASDSASRNSPRTEPLSPLKFLQDTEQSIDAHRQRELRWVSLMSSVLPAQARKTKKVKKLLLEGVPASVRYLVWSHVTNGREKTVAGVYAQLCSRGRVPASDSIEADIQRSFKDHPQLQGRESPVLTVLQAYLNMVPDTQYNSGLTRIVGQLLLQGPEEEVFWIFVSLMDTYLRPYFSTNNSQLEVDATLFSRALEHNDSQLAKRMLMDMSIPPEAICTDWFTSVFADTLPADFVNRVWDIFMYEGIPFLIRVGLAVVNCCRVQVLQATSDKMVLETIRHPPVRLLPPNPDAFVALALDQKLKDDDVRKQRIKMEAQVKRQTQAQVPRKSTATATISLPRT